MPLLQKLAGMLENFDVSFCLSEGAKDHLKKESPKALKKACVSICSLREIFSAHAPFTVIIIELMRTLEL